MLSLLKFLFTPENDNAEDDDDELLYAEADDEYGVGTLVRDLDDVLRTELLVPLVVEVLSLMFSTGECLVNATSFSRSRATYASRNSSCDIPCSRFHASNSVMGISNT